MKKLIISMVLVLGVFLGVSTLTAQASSLSPSQIQSILSLLSAFGVDQTTINNVDVVLTGQTTTMKTMSIPTTKTVVATTTTLGTTALPSPTSCHDTQAVYAVANSYLISKVGQTYFAEHYTPIGIDTNPNNMYPAVYYNYTLDGVNYSIETIGETIQDANIGYMDVTLNNGCTEALGASAVLDQVNSTITLAQAKSIATAQGYTVTKITPDFTGNWVDVGWVIDETLDYYVETSKECTALIINAVTSAVSVVSDCATPG